MIRQFNLLRRTRAILYLVEHDLTEVWSRADTTRQDQLPVIVVDWSEIFAYASACPPPQSHVLPGYEEDSSALHYAGLTYLFYQLPCRLLLVPPYLWEMRNYLDMLTTGVLREKIKSGDPHVAQRFDGVVDEIKKIERENPEFRKLLSRDYDEPVELTDDVRQLLRTVVTRYLPAIYLHLQGSTLEFLEAIQRLIYGSASQARRIVGLQDLDPALAQKTESALDHWRYWFEYMKRARPRNVVQNRIDAMALAYMEALHREFFWRAKNLFFATRSSVMFNVMGNHPGSFPPSLSSYLDNGLSSFSSARSWEYFAEIGYYLARRRQGDPLEEIRQRRLKVEVLLTTFQKESDLLRSDRNLYREFDGFRLNWENLRGTYDLEGLGQQRNWKMLRHRDDQKLAEIVTSILDERQPQEFLDEKATLAERILNTIDDILVRFPGPAMAERVVPLAAPHAVVNTRLFLPWRVLEALQPAALIESSFSPDSAPLVLRVLSGVEHSTVDSGAALDLLHYASKVSGAGAAEREQYLWLAGFALYAIDRRREAADLLVSWVDITKTRTRPALRLLTRGMIADCMHAGRARRGFLMLEEFGRIERSSMTRVEELVWLNLLARFVIGWIEKYKEDYDSYPYDGGVSIPERTFTRFSDCYKALSQSGTRMSQSLEALTYNNLLYGVARCIPIGEKLPTWIASRREELLHLAEQLSFHCEQDGTPQYLHTLGYFYWKFLVDSKRAEYADKAIRFLQRAAQRAEQTGEAYVQQLCAQQLAAAKDDAALVLGDAQTLP